MLLCNKSMSVLTLVMLLKRMAVRIMFNRGMLVKMGVRFLRHFFLKIVSNKGKEIVGDSSKNGVFNDSSANTLSAKNVEVTFICCFGG